MPASTPDYRSDRLRQLALENPQADEGTDSDEDAEAGDLEVADREGRVQQQ